MTLPGIPETWRHVVAVRNSTQMFFYRLRFKSDSFISDRDLIKGEKHKLSIERSRYC